MEELTKLEKIRLGTKEITKRIRNQLKENFKNCSFSVTHENYSGGSSITISLMKANFKVIRDFSEISEMALFKLEHESQYTKEQIKERQEKKYHQLNRFGFREVYDPTNWNNGVFLTEAGFNLFKKVLEIANQYNYDNSDSQTDYFNVNFYLHLNIGKWDKPFIGG